jgi:cyclophilin family peptidyl-prolyl cis-trans isomerase
MRAALVSAVVALIALASGASLALAASRVRLPGGGDVGAALDVLPPEPADPLRAGAAGNPMAVFRTSHGNIVVELLPKFAPRTVANFVNLSRTGFYRGTFLYRYVADFVIQGGGYYPNRTSNITVPLEYAYPNAQWTVGLARDGPDTGSSEYFFNLVNNTKTLAPGGSSRHGYAVFGIIRAGFSVVRALTMLPTFNSAADGTTEFVQPWPIVRTVLINGR